MKRVLFALLVIMLAVATAGWWLLRGEQNPRLVFIMAGEGRQENLYMIEPGKPDSLQQLTQLTDVILDFDTATDGSTIVYSLVELSNGYSDLYQLNISSGDTFRLTDCASVSSDCFAPVIAPNGDYVAYERSVPDRSADDPGQIWILDLTTKPPSSSSLIADETATGHGAFWSSDSTKLAYYDQAAGGIIVYDFTTRHDPEPQTVLIPAQLGLGGDFSPDGSLLVYPDMIFSEEDALRAFLQIIDLETELAYSLSDPGSGASDHLAAWSPDGRYVAIGRANAVGSGSTTQVYLWDTTQSVETSSVSPLVVDPLYNQSHLRWSPDSQWLAMMRLPQGATATPEIWVYHLAERRLVKIAEQARLPRWIP